MPFLSYIFSVMFLSKAATMRLNPRVKTSVLLPECLGEGFFCNKFSNKVGERYIPVVPLSY